MRRRVGAVVGVLAMGVAAEATLVHLGLAPSARPQRSGQCVFPETTSCRLPSS